MEQPTFNGRQIEYWFRARISGDDETRWEAVDAIRHLCGPESSVPLFLDSLRNDRYWRARALAAHALFDLAMDRVGEVNWKELMPILQTAASDSSDVVREQVTQLLDVLTNLDGPHR